MLISFYWTNWALSNTSSSRSLFIKVLTNCTILNTYWYKIIRIFICWTLRYASCWWVLRISIIRTTSYTWTSRLISITNPSTSGWTIQYTSSRVRVSKIIRVSWTLQYACISAIVSKIWYRTFYCTSICCLISICEIIFTSSFTNSICRVWCKCSIWAYSYTIRRS